jgi:hypothetical protein
VKSPALALVRSPPNHTEPQPRCEELFTIAIEAVKSAYAADPARARRELLRLLAELD